MQEETKSTYTSAQKRAIKKYLKESVDEFKVRMPKGQKERIKAHAESRGESMNQFVVRAITQTMEHEKREEEK